MMPPTDPAADPGRRGGDATSPRTLTVSMLQVESATDEPRAERIDRVARLVEQEIDDRAPDAIVLPELWPTGFFHADRYADEAEPIDGPTVQRLTALAGAGGIWLFGGSFVELSSDGSLHNTSICCSPAGRLAGAYRKIHLFGYESDEARVLTAGREVSVVDTLFGRVAMTTCYDLRFPELYRRLLDAGAELVVVCSAWPEARREHWELFNRARAAENLTAVIACNATGEQRGVALAGTSLVVSPWGEIITRAGTEPGWVRAELDLAEIASRREDFPALDDRRL